MTLKAREEKTFTSIRFVTSPAKLPPTPLTHFLLVPFPALTAAGLEDAEVSTSHVLPRTCWTPASFLSRLGKADDSSEDN